MILCRDYYFHVISMSLIGIQEKALIYVYVLYVVIVYGPSEENMTFLTHSLKKKFSNVAVRFNFCITPFWFFLY